MPMLISIDCQKKKKRKESWLITHGKNGFNEKFKILAGYRSEK